MNSRPLVWLPESGIVTLKTVDNVDDDDEQDGYITSNYHQKSTLSNFNCAQLLLVHYTALYENSWFSSAKLEELGKTLN